MFCVDKGWPLTAFKIDPDQHTDLSRPKVMRLSFKTSELFYPYRGFQAESNPKAPSRDLKLYVLAKRGVSIQNLAPGAIPPGTSWCFDAAVDDASLEKVAKAAGVPLSVLRGANRLTAFEDYQDATQRTEDLWIKMDSWTPARLPIEQPIESAVGIVGVAALGWTARSRFDERKNRTFRP